MGNGPCSLADSPRQAFQKWGLCWARTSFGFHTHLIFQSTRLRSAHSRGYLALVSLAFPFLVLCGAVRCLCLLVASQRAFALYACTELGGKGSFCRIHKCGSYRRCRFWISACFSTCDTFLLGQEVPSRIGISRLSCLRSYLHRSAERPRKFRRKRSFYELNFHFLNA